MNDTSTESASDAIVIRLPRTFTLWVLAGLLLLFAVMRVGGPETLWEFDEPLFAQAVLEYNPLGHHPPPPGYPLLIGLGKLVHLFVPDPVRALMILSMLATLIGFVFLSMAMRNIVQSAPLGVAAAFLFYFSASMLVHAPLPMSDPTGLALLAVALHQATRIGSAGLQAAGWFGAAAALTVGARPQLSLFVLPLLLTVWVAQRSWKERSVTALAFGVVCLGWLIPLMAAVGGTPADLYAYETKQAAYYAAHDAALSRSGRTPAQIAFRFIAHPWGPKEISFPILALAATGFVVLARRRRRAALIVAVPAAAYLGFALATMDPADAVRYAIPSLLGTAMFAAAGIGALSGVTRALVRPWMMVAAFVVASLLYTSPILLERRSGPSPPVRAAAWSAENLPVDAVVLFELPLWPHANYLLDQFEIAKVKEGTEAYWETEKPLYLLADGASRDPRATMFAWKDSDAYGKLTRNHYRVVSVVPIARGARFRPLDGVFAPERTVDGDAWRWLQREAEIELPAGEGEQLRIVLDLPENSDLESNLVTVFVDGAPAGRIRVTREDPVELVVTVPPSRTVIRFESERAVVPAEQGGLNRDPRSLAVQLKGIERMPVADAIETIDEAA